MVFVSEERQISISSDTILLGAFHISLVDSRKKRSDSHWWRIERKSCLVFPFPEEDYPSVILPVPVSRSVWTVLKLWLYCVPNCALISQFLELCGLCLHITLTWFSLRACNEVFPSFCVWGFLKSSHPTKRYDEEQNFVVHQLSLIPI